jgi:hypothetical protein
VLVHFGGQPLDYIELDHAVAGRDQAPDAASQDLAVGGEVDDQVRRGGARVEERVDPLVERELLGRQGGARIQEVAREDVVGDEPGGMERSGCVSSICWR